MKSFFLIICLSFPTLLLVNTEVSAKTESSENTEITIVLEQIIHENAKKMKADNIEGTMATIDSQSTLYASTKNLISRLFDIYELDYDITNIKFIAQDDELAYVRVKHITKKVTSQHSRTMNPICYRSSKKKMANGKSGHKQIWVSYS